MKEEKIQENVRKVDLSNLPRKRHNGRECFDWVNSVGFSVPFVYDEVSGTIKIIGYKKKDSKKILLDIEYNSKLITIQPAQLTMCKIARIVGSRPKQTISPYTYHVGEVVNTTNGSLEILNQFIKEEGKQRRKAYTYRCCKDGYEGEVIEKALKKGSGCAVCGNNAIKVGYNDIATTNSEIIKYLKHKEDGLKYSRYSGKRVEVVCPNCNEEKEIEIQNLITCNGIACKNCSDSYSFSNKFISAILENIGVEHEVEKSFWWSKRKRYDVYIENKNIIIEMNGIQHYENTYFGRGDKDGCLIREQENDKMKKRLAIKNINPLYYEIDCREHTHEYIKKTIIESGLFERLGFSDGDVDWNYCEKKAMSSKMKEVCDIFNNNTNDIYEISKIAMVKSDTVRKYLRKGYELGITNYSKEFAEKQRVEKMKNRKSKIITMYKDNIKVGTFKTYGEIEKISEKKFGTKLHKTGIRLVCMGDRESYKGFSFEIESA